MRSTALLLLAACGGMDAPAVHPAVESISPDHGARGTDVPVTISGHGFMQYGCNRMEVEGGIMLLDCQVGGDGMAFGTFRIGADTAPGAYHVRIGGADPQTTDGPTFTVN